MNNNLSAYNKNNLGIVSRIKNISPYDKNNEQKTYVNLKYNLSFKKNVYKQSETNNNNFNNNTNYNDIKSINNNINSNINNKNMSINKIINNNFNNNNDNNKLLYEKKYNLYCDYSNKNQHRTNSNDISIKRRAYINNIKGYYKKEKDGKQNHSNVDIKKLNRELSTSSIVSNNSQIKQNKNYRRRDYLSNNNLSNNTYNDIIQLKTEISERTKNSYFNNKNDIKPINNNLINNNNNNIIYTKKEYRYNNSSSNRDNIHYTKNNKYTKNIVSKKLNFQLNYESNQQKENINNLLVKKQ